MPATTPVPAPPATPPLHGLIATLGTVKDAGIRWQNPEAVITYLPEGCGEGLTIDTCSPDPMVPINQPTTVEWKPYALTWSDDCSAFSGDANNEARTRRRLNADTERQLGAEFWDGALAQSALLPSGDPYPNTWLANVADVDILTESGDVALTHGLACLDEYLCDLNFGSQGAIHCTCQTLTQWWGLHLLRYDAEQRAYFSPAGNLIIDSPGYSGTSPDGDVGDCNIWAYATDTPRVWLGDIQSVDPMQSSNRRQNDKTVFAQRSGLVEFERCRHAGVRLSMVQCSTGGS